jgi:CheY-like chemotaxis protein
MLTSSFLFGTRTKPLSVIIADDVAEIRHLVGLWLREAGCTVTATASGNELTKLIRAQPYDVIITDIIMPDGDGLEVILEAKRTLPNTPVLAISGGGQHLQATDCLRFAKGLGAQAVLMKPFNREQLLDAVNHVANSAIGSRHPHPLAEARGGA